MDRDLLRTRRLRSYAQMARKGDRRRFTKWLRSACDPTYPNADLWEKIVYNEVRHAAHWAAKYLEVRDGG